MHVLPHTHVWCVCTVHICLRDSCGCVLTWCETVCACVWLWFTLYFPILWVCVPRIFVASTAIDHVCLHSLGRASPKHSAWIIKQPVKKTNELNKPALRCYSERKQMPIRTCSIDQCVWDFLGQWINTCPGFHFHQGFFCAGKSCVWPITIGLECTPSWPDGRRKTAHTHMHIIIDAVIEEKWWAECCVYVCACCLHLYRDIA